MSRIVKFFNFICSLLESIEDNNQFHLSLIESQGEQIKLKKLISP